MKHPLTSKERRGLVAVAAAALSCIAAGPLMRSCSAKNAQARIESPKEINTSLHQDKSDWSDRSEKSDRSYKSKKSKKKNKPKTKKIIPERRPLDQPCDLF